MRRFREQTIETACFYNTVGFIDDTRAFLAKLVVEHRSDEDEAAAVAQDLAYTLVKRAYRL